MSCCGCSVKYSLVNKEKACKNCGYSYCRHCLKHSIAVPKRQNAVCEVCWRCYSQLSKADSKPEPQQIEFPKNFLKHQEERLKRERETTTTVRNQPSTSQPHGNQTDDLRARLDALRMTTPADSEAVLRSRLDALKANQSAAPPNQSANASSMSKDNAQPKLASANGLFVVPQPRSQQQQVDQLLDQIMSEVKIDEATKQDRSESQERTLETEESINARLNRLAAEANQLGVPQVDVAAILREAELKTANYGRIETVNARHSRAKRRHRKMDVDNDDDSEDDEDYETGRAFECTLCGVDKQLELFTCPRCDDIRRVCSVCFRALHNAKEYDFLKGHVVQRILFD